MSLASGEETPALGAEHEAVLLLARRWRIRFEAVLPLASATLFSKYIHIHLFKKHLCHLKGAVNGGQ